MIGMAREAAPAPKAKVTWEDMHVSLACQRTSVGRLTPSIRNVFLTFSLEKAALQLLLVLLAARVPPVLGLHVAEIDLHNAYPMPGKQQYSRHATGTSSPRLPYRDRPLSTGILTCM